MTALAAGDIMACYGTDAVSRIISWQTLSLAAPRGLKLGPSHVAVMLPIAGELLWCESTSMSPRPCVYAGRAVSGCQLHAAEPRIEDYKATGGAVVLYRLADVWTLSGTEQRQLGDIYKRHFVAARKSYDYGGAAISGTRLWKWLPVVPDDALESLFCSELIAALLMRMGRMNIDNATRFNPGSLLRRLVSTGVYRRVGAL